MQRICTQTIYGLCWKCYQFGTTKNGSIINLFHLENTSGAYVEIIDFGCRLTKIVVPDRNGDPVDVCLGFSTADHYADDDASLGAVAVSYTHLTLPTKLEV